MFTDWQYGTEPRGKHMKVAWKNARVRPQPEPVLDDINDLSTAFAVNDSSFAPLTSHFKRAYFP